MKINIFVLLLVVAAALWYHTITVAGLNKKLAAAIADKGK